MNNVEGRRKVKITKAIPAAPRATGVEALRNRPGISPDQLLEAGVMPLSRNGLYDALQRGQIESFRLGKKIIIPTAPLLRKLGIVG
jgi:hypothetical protein